MKMRRHYNLWDATKAVFTGKFIVLNDYLRKEESFTSMTSTFMLRSQKKKNKLNAD